MKDTAWDIVALVSVLWLVTAGPVLYPTASGYIAIGVVVIGVPWIAYELRRLWKGRRG